MRPLSILMFVALVLAGGAGLAVQRRATAALRAQVAERQRLAAEARQVADEHRRLAAAQVAPEDLARSRDDRALLTALAAEVESVRLRTRAEPAPVAPAPAAAARPWLRREEVPAEAWADRGAADPDAAFETALWAASHGDLDTLAGLLVLDEDARAAATALFTRLPAALRAELGTPEKLVALFTARAIPLTTARILTQTHEDGDAKLVAQLRDGRGVARAIQVGLKSSGENWQLVVPAAAVDKFIDQLRPPSVALTPVSVSPGP